MARHKDQVEELFDNSSSALGNDSSDPEWMKEDPKTTHPTLDEQQLGEDDDEQESGEDEESSGKDEHDLGEDGILEVQAMSSTGNVVVAQQGNAHPTPSTQPTIGQATIDKAEKGGRQLIDHDHVSNLVRDY